MLICCKSTGNINGEKTDETTNYNDYIIFRGGITIDGGNYYFLDQQILYVMGQELFPVPLCSKPECEHEDDSCNAWLDTASIYASGGRLYYIEQTDNNKLSLISLSLTASDKKYIKSLWDSKEAYSDPISYAYRLVGNHLIMEITTTTVEETKTGIYLTTLDETGKITQLCQAQNDGTDRLMLWKCTSDWAFLIGKNTEKGYELYAVNLNTEEQYLVMEDYNTDIVDLYISEEDIYWFDLKKGFFRLNIESMDREMVRSVNSEYEFGGGIYDDHYMYLINDTAYSDEKGLIPEEKQGLYIYDRNGGQLNFLSTSGVEGYLSYAFSTEEKIFFYDFRQHGPIPTYYIEKKQIGTDQLEWFKISE